MGEHAAFIAQLLDPQERLLIGEAEKLHDSLVNPATLRGDGMTDPVMKAARKFSISRQWARRGSGTA
jgi:hypothetical protein